VVGAMKRAAKQAESLMMTISHVLDVLENCKVVDVDGNVFFWAID